MRATGLAHHYETNACEKAPHLNRQTVYEVVRSKDPNDAITKHLIGWVDEVYIATESAFNGQTWECYFCTREFHSRRGLDQHLKSPVHRQSLYHCPKRGCRQDFKTLAAAINHLESESCGYMTFDSVQRQMDGLVSSTRRLAL